MKTKINLLLSLLILCVLSCRDTKKEEAETEVVVEQIEAIEVETQEVSEEIDKKAKELENELNELDNL